MSPNTKGGSDGRPFHVMAGRTVRLRPTNELGQVGLHLGARALCGRQRRPCPAPPFRRATTSRGLLGPAGRERASFELGVCRRHDVEHDLTPRVHPYGTATFAPV